MARVVIASCHANQHDVFAHREDFSDSDANNNVTQCCVEPENFGIEPCDLEFPDVRLHI
jgi:hypothetical protein